MINAQCLALGEIHIALLEELIRIAGALSSNARRYTAHLNALYVENRYRQQIEELKADRQGAAA